MLGEGGKVGYPSFNHYYKYVNKYGVTTDGVRVYFEKNDTGTKDRCWFSMKIKVPVAGNYIPSLKYDQASSFEKELKIYILDVNTTKAEIDEKVSDPSDTAGFVGTVDSCGDAKDKTTSLSLIPLEAKEYLVVFYSPNYNNIRIKNLTLTSGDGSKTVPMYAEATLSDNTLDAGKNETATLGITKILMSDTTWVEGDAVDALGITYESSDENVVKVESGIVTAIARGKATVYAKMGESVLAEKTVTVEDTSLCGVKVVYPFSSKLADVIYALDKAAEDAGEEKKSIRGLEYTTEKSCGRAQWHSQKQNSGLLASISSYALCIYTVDVPDDIQYAACEIYVPAAGKYDVKQQYVAAVNGTKNNMYILDYNTTDISAALKTATPVLSIDCSGNKSLDNSLIKKGTAPYALGKWIATVPGKYIVVWTGSGELDDRNASDRWVAFLGDLTLDGGDGAAITGGKFTADDSTIVKGKTTATKTSGYLSTTGTALTSFTYTSSNPAVATVDANTGVVTAVSGGVAKITATCAEAIDGYNSVSTLIAVDEPTTTVSFGFDSSVDGISITSDYTQGEVVSVQRETEIAVSAPETATVGGKNYVFRGWVRGKADGGRVISLDAEYSFTAMTNTYLTAIYTEAADEEYYAWNGEFLGTTKPSAPEVVGYSFSEWKESLVNSVKRFVAQYTQLPATYGVTYNGKTTQHKYDAPVTLTSNENVYWFRDGKLVDYGESYTFNVWDETEVTTSSEGHDLPMLALDAKTKDDNYMVEYDANGKTILEVGILFNAEADGAPIVSSCKEKMSSQRNLAENPHGQFAAKAGSYTKARGYLIYEDNGAYKVIYSE